MTTVVPDSLNDQHYLAICFFRGELYGASFSGSLICFGNLKDHKNTQQPRLVANWRAPNTYPIPANTDAEEYYYLVESKYDQSDQGHTSSLLLIHKLVFVESYDECKYTTVSFRVFKLNFDNGNVEEVKSLGNQAIFVGFNSPFVVQVDDDRGCKADCIYYTDDSAMIYLFDGKGGGSDMGIYSLAQGNTHPFYEGPSRFSDINTPLWIELSSA